MATSGSLFSGKDSRGYQLRIYWYERIVNNNDLRKNIGFDLYLRSTRDNFYFSNYTLDAYLDASGTNDAETRVIDKRQQYSIADPNSGISEVLIGSGNKSFQHSPDGTCTITIEASLFTVFPASFTPENLYTLKTVVLDPFDVAPPTPAPTFSGSLGNATAGSFYYDTLTVTDANSVSSSGLPPGISASFNGSTVVVSGTPTSTGSYTASFTATGPTGLSTTYNDGIFVSTPTPSFSGSFNSAEQNVFYSDSISIFNADSAFASGLPSGLSGSFSGSTFTVSGTPSVSGTYSFSISASNVYGGSNSNNYSIYIAPPANPTWTDQNIDGPFLVGIPYSDSVTANNATSVTFSGSLPDGLTQSTTSNSCTISGTPQQKATEFEMDSYTFTITVNGESGTSPISKQFTIPLRFPGARINSSGAPEDLRTARRYQDGQWLPINTRAERFDGSNWQDVNEV